MRCRRISAIASRVDVSGDTVTRSRFITSPTVTFAGTIAGGGGALPSFAMSETSDAELSERGNMAELSLRGSIVVLSVRAPGRFAK